MTGFYDYAASLVRPEILKAIEDSIPCSNSLGHLWDWGAAWVDGWHDIWWECALCGATNRTDTRKPWQKVRDEMWSPR